MVRLLVVPGERNWPCNCRAFFIMYYGYVIYSFNFDRIYIGQTDNLNLRVTKHNLCLVKSTKRYVPGKLIHYEIYLTRGEAMKREKYLKSHTGRDFIRNNFINRQSPAKPD